MSRKNTDSEVRILSDKGSITYNGDVTLENGGTLRVSSNRSITAEGNFVVLPSTTGMSNASIDISASGQLEVNGSFRGGQVALGGAGSLMMNASLHGLVYILAVGEVQIDGPIVTLNEIGSEIPAQIESSSAVTLLDGASFVIRDDFVLGTPIQFMTSNPVPVRLVDCGRLLITREINENTDPNSTVAGVPVSSFSFSREGECVMEPEEPDIPGGGL